MSNEVFYLSTGLSNRELKEPLQNSSPSGDEGEIRDSRTATEKVVTLTIATGAGAAP
jgi:hypothetical protein